MEDTSKKRFADPMDLLRALPSILVETNIYPYAVRVIEDRMQLIQAVKYWKNRSDEVHRRFPIGQWDVEQVTDFSHVFEANQDPPLFLNMQHCSSIGDISSWNVVNGTTFERMFFWCRSFNCDLSSWNMANATNLNHMFCGCTSFNSNLSGWNVANATNLCGMFFQCRSFNRNLSKWNVANATNLGGMFFGCRSFNSDLSEGNVGNATDLGEMFKGCRLFNSDLSQWDLLNVREWEEMFERCESFNAEFELVVSDERQISIRRRT